MKLPTNLRFSDQKVRKAFEELQAGNNKQQQLYHRLQQAFKDIKENAFCGIQVPTRLIPKIYLKKYSIKNLWKYNLPDAWRLLYSIENHEIQVVSIVLEWMDHKTYERRFGY